MWNRPQLEKKNHRRVTLANFVRVNLHSQLQKKRQSFFLGRVFSNSLSLSLSLI